tara:strand:- start:393 stop:665 length:273 start_codon:yes stop_codon:yes gene_type:complete
MIIKPSTKKGKRLMAIFENGTKVHFGLDGGQTYLEHGDKAKRAAYLARHAVNEKWDDPYTAGSLSRWLLWGDSQSISTNLEAFKSRFKLK